MKRNDVYEWIKDRLPGLSICQLNQITDLSVERMLQGDLLIICATGLYYYPTKATK